MWPETSKLSDSPTSTNTLRWILVDHAYFDTTLGLMGPMHVVFDESKIHHLSEHAPSPHLTEGLSGPESQAQGTLLLPLFFETHAHLYLRGAELDFEKRKEEQKQEAETLLQQTALRAQALLEFGVGTSRDGGDNLGAALALQEKKGRSLPEVHSPGSAVHREKRYGSFFARPSSQFRDPKAVVEDRLQRGGHHLKLVISGIIDFEKGEVKGKPQFSIEEVRAFVHEAHRQGFKVMAHASGEEGLKHAILGGVDTVEHGFFMTEEILMAMKERGTIWVPTFAPVQVQVREADTFGWSDLSRRNLELILTQHREMVRKALSIGVTVLAGSDAGSVGVPHGLGFLEELEALEGAGMPIREILDVACIKPHRVLLDRSGPVLKEGSPARFQIVSDRCLEFVRHLRQERKVMIDGKEVIWTNRPHASSAHGNAEKIGMF